MLVVTRLHDGRTLEVPRAVSTYFTREDLNMGDDERVHSPSEPTSYISQKQPVEVHIDANGSLTIINKQPFLLCRGGELGTHHGHLTDVRPTDRICFCPRRFVDRGRATFSFRVTPDGSDTEEEEEVKEVKEVKQPEVEQPNATGWRTKKRALPRDFAPVDSGIGKRCGICGRIGHNRRTCRNVRGNL